MAEGTGEPLGDAYVEISAKTQQFDAAMSGVQGKFQGTVNNLDAAAASMATRIGGWLAAAFSVRKFYAELVSTEEAANNLAIAIKAAGANVDEMLPKLDAFANRMMNLTVHDDDLIKRTMAVGLQIGIQADQIERATKAAIGLSARYNLDLNTAMMFISRQAIGGTVAWGRYGIVIDETLSKTEQFNEILKRGEESFAAAEAKTKTLGGQMQILGRNFANAGGSILGAFMDVSGARNIIQGLGEAFEDIRKKVDAATDTRFWRLLSTSVGQAGLQIGALAYDLENMVKTGVFDKTFTHSRKVFAEWIEYINKGKDAAKGLKDIKPNAPSDQDLDKNKRFFSSIEDAWKKQMELASKSTEAAAAADKVNAFAGVVPSAKPSDGLFGPRNPAAGSMKGSGTEGYRKPFFALPSMSGPTTQEIAREGMNSKMEALLERIAANTDPQKSAPFIAR